MEMMRPADTKVRIRQQVILLALALGACGGPLQLTKFTFESDELEACTLAALPADAKVPCGAQDNPFVTSEQEYLECFGGMLLAPHQHRHQHSADAGQDSTSSTTSELVAELEEFLFSIYQGEGEAGIFGLRFSHAQAAQRAAALLRLRGAEHSKVHTKGNLVVYVWHDEGADGCSAKLDSLVKSRIR